MVNSICMHFKYGVLSFWNLCLAKTQRLSRINFSFLHKIRTYFVESPMFEFRFQLLLFLFGNTSNEFIGTKAPNSNVVLQFGGWNPFTCIIKMIGRSQLRFVSLGWFSSHTLRMKEMKKKLRFTHKISRFMRFSSF